MIGRMLRAPASLLTAALFLATGIGIPVHHHADHDGDGVHLAAGDHGHGATLVVRDMRNERPGTTVDATPAVTVVPLTSPRTPDGLRASRIPPAPRGRSPPLTGRPRGPPLLS